MHRIILFIVLQSVFVKSDLCDVCMCKYDRENKQDFKGMTVDCSHARKDFLEQNYTLPSPVHKLDLSTIGITNVKSTSVLKSNSMTELLLNDNSIIELRDKVFELPELQRLDLSDNQLEFISREVFENMKLEYLNLANNKLTTVDTLKLHALSGLKEIILDNNNIGPSLRKVNIFDQNGFGLTRKIESLSIRGINFNNVPLHFFNDAYGIKKLIISNNNITNILFDIPYEVEYLDLSDNPIALLQDGDFHDLPILKTLKLNNLTINEVPDHLFSSVLSLKVLELERNKKMTRFSNLAFGPTVLHDAADFSLERLSLKNGILTRLDKSLSEPISKLIELDLQGNPWKCDCNLRWIRDLQISTALSEDVRCGSPVSFFNKNVFDIPKTSFICPISRHFTGLMIAGVSFAVSLAAIGIWIVFILPTYNSRGKYINVNDIPYTIIPVHATGLHT